MTYKDCFDKGLIKEDNSAVKRVPESINKAEQFLASAKRNLADEDFDTATLIGYNSVFCANQALLFSKGLVEHSHACLAYAIREHYNENKDLMRLLNSINDLRITRHRIQYSGYNANAEIADFVVALAQDYLDLVKELLKC
jgi:uncharacterized protein (UPF0332 family)